MSELKLDDMPTQPEVDSRFGAHAQMQHYITVAASATGVVSLVKVIAHAHHV
eukprot:CAMPEP_0179446400 /NCGR_PEP_ID=MMETSP0799-20121207/29771_1 /TAXON_ID=46947 /ORGANISM="Geminigera cryophila, Strain CCMP2564" /LENGTH=51 /DNA_ID=CAMNT_0021235255 /DNA_START=204 /DNA_END=359 /DNA_ORIENTATION=-